MADGIRQHALDLLARIRETRPKKEETDDEEYDVYNRCIAEDDETIDYGFYPQRNSAVDDGYETTSTSTAFSHQFSRVGYCYDEEEGFREDAGVFPECYTIDCDGTFEEDEPTAAATALAAATTETLPSRSSIKDNNEATRMQALKVLNMVGDYGQRQPLSLESANHDCVYQSTKRKVIKNEGLEPQNHHHHTTAPPQQLQLRPRRRTEKSGNDRQQQPLKYSEHQHEEQQPQFGAKKNSTHYLRSPRFSTKARRLSRHLAIRFSQFDETLRMVLIVSGSVILAGCIYFWL
jgi:hypothetical protein